MLDPDLGAGALLDMGIYPLTFAHLLLGEAEQLRATADLSPGWHRPRRRGAGRYPGGALATMTASMTSWSSRRAEIATDRGRIEVDDFHHPTRATFTPYAAGGGNGPRARRSRSDIDARRAGARRRLRPRDRRGRPLPARGLRESPLVPHAQTLALMRQMDDAARADGDRLPRWGLAEGEVGPGPHRPSRVGDVASSGSATS